MSADYCERTIVLKVGRFRESDMWVRFFSPSRGLLTGFAFGGAKSRRRFCGCLDAFNHVTFQISSSRRGEYLNLEEGVLIKSPTRLRSDNERLGLAVNCTKFLEAFYQGCDCEGGYAQTYEMLCETLEVLDSEREVPKIFPLFFRAKLAFTQGYLPDMCSCGFCGAALDNPSQQAYSKGRTRFLIEQGRMACCVCELEKGGMSLNMSPGTLKTMERVYQTSPQKWLGIKLSAQVRREFAGAVDNFVRFHLGLAWENGRFRTT